MSISAPPADPSAQLQWLVDRAALSDLLVELADALDARDGARYATLYTEDGVLELPGGVRAEGREQLQAGVERGIAHYDAVWHLSANHAIELDGDAARTRSYVIAVHRHGPKPEHHATGAGWYTNTARRTPVGWRFSTVRLEIVWTAGEGPLPA